MKAIIKRELQAGYYFSPRFYVGYWENVLKSFDPKTVLSDNRFKQHREVWIGAVLAAVQTKITGVKHYVGIPQSEPPDVEVIRLMPGTAPSGKEGLVFQSIKVEITRCNQDVGESLIGQIDKKNTPAYGEMTLAIYAYGGDEAVHFKTLFDLLKTKKVFPREILVVGLVRATESGIIMPDNTFAVTQVYPRLTQTIVKYSHTKSFFRHPEVIVKTRRGISIQLEKLGKFMLLPPSVK